MNKIKVIIGGLLTTIQDFGRFAFQSYGVPVSGAMDTLAMQLANYLTFNNRNEAVLEITLLGPTFEFQCDAIFAITGADLSASLDGAIVQLYQTNFAKKGEVLSFGSIVKGARAYLSFKGGFEISEVMGSKSTYTKALIGGYEGRKLNTGDELILSLRKPNFDNFEFRQINSFQAKNYFDENEIRVLEGPEERSFKIDSINDFYNEKFTISNQCDRMGIRIDGKKIEHVASPDIISSGVNLGTIQVAGNGSPIIMMADRQTTGGYTRIANVISVDIPILAQKKPGDIIHFQKVKIEEAQELYKLRESHLENLFNDRLDLDFSNANNFSSNNKNFRLKINQEIFIVCVEEVLE